MISHLRYIAGTAAMLLLMASCRKAEIPTYTTSDDIYFSVVRDYVTYDTTIVTFAYTPRTTDTTMYLKIAALGKPAGRERNVSYRVVDTAANAAVLHKHFELPAKLAVPADSVSCYLPVVMHKTEDMSKRTFSITLQLEPNNDFQTRLQLLVKDKNNNRFTSLLRHVIIVDNKLNIPDKGWYEDFYGPFTSKKMLLMGELLELSIQDLYNKIGSADPGATRFYANYLKTYLKDMEAAGTPVQEDDGTLMKLGKYMQ
ncbi:DUF4843 domain-containing protein [Chitinophaga qingshengii]|uniref:DUF4843 domain-containing protein n=1 Tax=Chitinophaga qingshengii TaxID=1569794 RepID=A0ABR7TNS2_9BACT|nr:DUF4843 domain-containing protein [Chitinophaga qingshengii]MBC9931079.1 DUF4843 domain-containing protein [Chitinophaga qingshengii]